MVLTKVREHSIENLNGCDALTRLVVTNTVPLQGKNLQCQKLVTIDISPTLGTWTLLARNGIEFSGNMTDQDHASL